MIVGLAVLKELKMLFAIRMSLFGRVNSNDQDGRSAGRGKQGLYRNRGDRWGLWSRLPSAAAATGSECFGEGSRSFTCPFTTHAQVAPTI